MASKMDSSEVKVSSRKSCEKYDSTAYMGSKNRSTLSIREEEGSGSTIASRISWYSTYAANNGISIPMCDWTLYDIVGEGRVQGSLKYKVQKGTSLIDDEDSLEMAWIWWIGAMKSKLPIKEEYIPTPTFLVSYW
jgi:hypothetical protein